METKTKELLAQAEENKTKQGRVLNGDDFFDVAHTLGEDHPDHEALMDLCRQADTDDLRALDEWRAKHEKLNTHKFVLENGDTIHFKTEMDEETARQSLVFGLVLS
jgi:hypothetical protein